MADLSDLLKRSATSHGAAFEPSPDLPQRIARRTLQLQRRRRGGVVGGTVALAVAALAFSLVVNPTLNDSTAVSVPFEPAKTNASKRPSTTNTATAAAPATATAPAGPLRLPDLSGLSPKERAKVRKRYAAARKQRGDDRPVATEVSGAQATRGGSANPGTRAGPRRPTTTTRRRGTTTTTEARPTTTTAKPPPPPPPPPPPTTPPPTTPPPTPLEITGPAQVCAGVPTQFRATGTGAELVVWSNLQVGAVATYTLTESANVSAFLKLPGVSVQKQLGVQVVPTGTPPC